MFTDFVGFTNIAQGMTPEDKTIVQNAAEDMPSKSQEIQVRELISQPTAPEPVVQEGSMLLQEGEQAKAVLREVGINPDAVQMEKGNFK